MKVNRSGAKIGPIKSFHGVHLIVVALAVTACGGGEKSLSPAPSASLPKADQTVISMDGNKREIAASANALSLPSASGNEAKENSWKPKPVSRPTPVLIDLGSPKPDFPTISKQLAGPVGTPLQLGFAREVSSAQNPYDTGRLLRWTSTVLGGVSTSVLLLSNEAKGMRIGLFVKSISPLATIRFYSSGADSAVEVSGKDVLATIQSNTSQGDQSDEARTYWGPYLAGAQGVVEIELPKGVDASTAQVAIPRITHFFLDPLDSKVLTTGAKQSGYCEVDVSCKTPLPAASNAVALMLFSKNGGAYSCTGTLLNEVGGSGTPYFLTAYHCISSQTVASSLETYWFYRSSACNNGILNPGYQSRSGGARLLYTRQTDSGPGEAGPAGTDTSFMVLNSTPPAGAIYAGWTTVGQAPSATNLYQGIHHPFGDLQKTSEGTVTTFAYVNGPTATTSPLQSGWPMYNVRFTSGTTELGSSGSALFFNGFSSSAANPQLVGQLLGGNSSCANPTGTNLYGRFDLPYLDGMYLWLSGYLQPVYRFYNIRTNAHFFTSSVIERDRVKLTNSDFSYEGSAFQTSPRAGNSVSPVYRFYNTSTGTHFYTISPAERNSIIARLPQYSFEGTAWYASPSPTSGLIPLFRFYNKRTDTHFYTASAEEKDSVIARLADVYNFEGIAYYVKSF